MITSGERAVITPSVKARKIGARTECFVAQALTRGDEIDRFDPLTRFAEGVGERFAAGESATERDLGALALLDRGEEIAVAGEAEQRLLFASGGPRRCAPLLGSSAR